MAIPIGSLYINNTINLGNFVLTFTFSYKTKEIIKMKVFSTHKMAKFINVEGSYTLTRDKTVIWLTVNGHSYDIANYSDELYVDIMLKLYKGQDIAIVNDSISNSIIEHLTFS